MKFRKFILSLCPQEIPFTAVGHLLPVTNLSPQHSSFKVNTNHLLDSYFEKNKLAQSSPKRKQ